jgi:tryptophan synthase
LIFIIIKNRVKMTNSETEQERLESIYQAKARYGAFGGSYVPEPLVKCLAELETCFLDAMKDPAFIAELESYHDYMGRASQLQYANRLTEDTGGAKIWLKREDLNHTGSHKINNTIGQILLAKRLGKTRVIAETGAGQHGVATATVCAKFGLKCVIYMGAEDCRRQALNVFRIRMLGAEVVPVTSGTMTLKDAVDEALNNWVVDLSNTHFLVGSAVGPHPFPMIVREFQSIIGRETKSQMLQKAGKLPDAVVACVGGGSNAIGMFHEFIGDESVRILGVEAAGDGVETKRHAATLTLGRPGVLHGAHTYLLQNDKDEVLDTHCISAGLDYPGGKVKVKDILFVIFFFFFFFF